MNALMCFTCGRECMPHQERLQACCENPRIKEVEDVVRDENGRLIDVREIARAFSVR